MQDLSMNISEEVWMYKCSKCRFYVHLDCATLRGEPFLSIFSHGFVCKVCKLHCNGFGYDCSTCDYRINVHCGFMPKTITHEAHPNHLLSVSYPPSSQSTSFTCNACDIEIMRSEICFKCTSCDFYLDSRCALHLPKTIKNKYDKHPLNLSYFPIENHKSQYFCEVCEEYLNPEKWFYHCSECGQSIHSACASLILQSEQDVNSPHVEGVYMFLNIKFGVIDGASFVKGK
ncbi:hypothetical protein R6Q59_032842 [Mikania micrantha]